MRIGFAICVGKWQLLRSRADPTTSPIHDDDHHDDDHEDDDDDDVDDDDHEDDDDDVEDVQNPPHFLFTSAVNLPACLFVCFDGDCRFLFVYSFVCFHGTRSWTSDLVWIVRREISWGWTSASF